MNNLLRIPDSFESISNLVELLRYQASHHGDKVLYSFLANGEDIAGSLTFSELDERAMTIAANLQHVTSTGDRVLLMFSPGLNYISAFMGCLYAGLVAVPSYPINNRRRDANKLKQLILDCEPAVTLISNQQQALYNQADSVFTGSRLLEIDNLNPELTWRQRAIDAHSLAFLQYTSGSTGSPKGVMVSHHNLLSNLDMIRSKGSLLFGDIGVSWLPPYHDMGLIGGLLTPMYVGMHMLLMEPVAFLQKPFRWLKAISDYKASSSAAPNFAYQLCVDRVTDEQLESLDLSHLKFALSGAEPVRESTMQAFCERFAKAGFKPHSLFPAYGMAETTLLIAGAQSGKPYKTLFADSTALFDNKISQSDDGKCFVSCGEADSDHRLVIVNPNNQTLLTELEIGEIWVQGPSVAQGYWRNKELSEATFAAQIKGQAGAWLRTGDLGFIKDQQVYISGRIKDLIVIRGRNLYPQDIENVVYGLDEQLSVDGCAAFSVDNGHEETLILVQELTRQGLRSADITALATIIRREIMARYSVSVADVVFIKPMTLPRTSSGKIQHSATRTAYQKNTLAIKGNVPLIASVALAGQVNNQDIEVTLTQPSILSSESVEIFDQSTILTWIKQSLSKQYPFITNELPNNTAFVDLGIDSVASIELTRGLSDFLGYEISATDIWDYPTLNELSAYASALSDEANKSQQINSPSSTKKIQTIKSKVATESNDIAVIGMACRLPGGEGRADIESVHSLWQSLLNGDDLVGPLPHGRYADMSLSDDDDFPEGGYLQSIDQFDPAFFDLSPKDAACLDPQQRLLLQTSIRLLEDAYLTLDDLKETKTGIFIGSSTDDYAQLSLNSLNLEDSPGYVGLGTARSVMVGRLAYFLATHGPALQVDTACSSSAYAIHLACQSLLSGESSQVIAGGVNLIMNVDSYAALETLQAISPSGRCRTFSDDADGYIRSEACSLVMLKRVDDAVRDGDRIYGVIKASQANHDGRSNGLTAPSGKAQQRLIEEVMRTSGIAPHQIGYIETHGTGTALGDPIEVKALSRVFTTRAGGEPIKLGALKSQLGHSESAAGVMALIKTMLCLESQRIPANLHFDKPNSHINWAELNVEPVNQAQSWPLINDRPALAGISSFGLSGTNVHCIVGPAPIALFNENSEPSLSILKLSATTSASLALQINQASATAEVLQKQPLLLQEVMRASHYKSDHVWRASIVARDEKNLQKVLRQLSSLDDVDLKKHSLIHSTGELSANQPIVFLFTGQGALYQSIALELFQSSSIFRQHIQCCQQLLIEFANDDQIDTSIEFDLSQVLYAQTAEQSSSLLDPQYAQVSLFAIQTALVELLRYYHVEATDVVGHSVGEYAAAYCAGVLSLRDGLRLLMHRGDLTGQCPAGKMLAVSLPLNEIEKTLSSLKHVNITVAATNSLRQTVLAGQCRDIEALSDHLKSEGIKAQLLSTSHAFHSDLMSSMVEEFHKIAVDVMHHTPKINWFSTVLSRKIEAEEVNANYWCQHIVQPVKFEQTMSVLREDIASRYPQIHQLECIELGPQPVLSAILRSQVTHLKHAKELSLSALPMLKKPINGRYTDVYCLSNVISSLYLKGADIKWPRQIPHNTTPSIQSAYQFDQKRYWLSPKLLSEFSSATVLADNGLMQRLQKSLLNSGSSLSDEGKALIPQLLPMLIDALGVTMATPSVVVDEQRKLAYQVQWTQQEFAPSIGVFSSLLLHGKAVNENLKTVFKHRVLLDVSPEGVSFDELLSEQSEYLGDILNFVLSEIDNDKLVTNIILDLGSFAVFLPDFTVADYTLQSRQLLKLTQRVMSYFDHLLGCDISLIMPDFISENNDDRVLNESRGHVFAPVWGSIKSIVHEQLSFNKMVAYSIDTDADIECLRQVCNYNGPDFEFILRDERVLCPRLTAVSDVDSKSMVLGDNTQASSRAYVITGGCGALGLALTAHLVANGANTIVLVNRRAKADLSSNTASLIQQWEQHGCKIHVESVDVTQPLAVADLFERLPNILNNDVHLQGIYHLAGAPADTELFSQTHIDNWDAVWQPKVMGAWWLHTYSQSLQPKEFVLFSSVASLLGYVGQAAYSSANFYLDWLAAHRQQYGLPATAINWGPWQGDGMAASALVNKAMAQVGIHGLIASEALSAMTSNMRVAQMAVIDIDWSRLKQHFNSRLVQGLLGDITEFGTEQPIQDSVRNLQTSLIDQPAHARHALVLEWLMGCLSTILDSSPSELDVQRSLISLGMDSIRSLDLKHEIQKETGIDVPVTLFLDNTSLRGLADYLVEQFDSSDARSNTNDGLLLNSGILADPKGSPVSAAQQRLWLVDQWQQQKGLYNIHSTIRVEGEFDAERFSVAMQAVINRHEALRTHFSENSEGLLQCVNETLQIPTTHHYWPSQDDNDNALTNFARHQAHQEFDLACGPLMAIAVVHIDAKPITYVCLTLHHIIADAWSMDVLIRDFSLAYVTQHALPELPIQYRHYSAWQRQFLAQRLPQLEAYWLPQLSDASSTQIPSDLVRPERQDLSGRCVRFSISKLQSKQLKELAEKQGVTLFVLLLSSFFVLLSKLTKKHDLLIGTDIANRDQATTNDLIGFFVNVLALRTDLSGNPVFSDIVQRVNRIVQDSITHQDMPFHHLVDKLKVPRQSDRNPLVQILFVLQNAQSADLQLDGLDIKPVDIDEQVCRFDQSLFIKEHNEQLEGYWHYATAVFTPTLIADQSTQFCTILNRIIDNPTQSLEILTMNSNPDFSNAGAQARKARKRSSFGKFKKSPPMPIAPKALVEKRPYEEGALMPLVVTATNQEIDAAGWASAEREGILSDLETHGAILFRDFPLANAVDFELFAAKICPSLFGDYGDLPKEKGGKKIYHSTPYPKDKRILFHNESSHMHQWPTRQLFFCVKAAEQGGATPIVDCREIYRQLDPNIRDEFENKHLRYVRNFSRNLDVSWQQFFKTEDRDIVEAICQRTGVEYEWLGDDGLRTHELRRAVTTHEGSGLKSFFNQIQLHHSAFLPQEVRQSLMAITGLEGLPRHVTFGDGSPISDEVALHTYELYERLAVRFDWQPGDVVLLDNMAVAHARDAFEGDRKINVAMGEMVSQQGAILYPDADEKDTKVSVNEVTDSTPSTIVHSEFHAN